MEVKDFDIAKVGKLPRWVKCMKCGKGPRHNDLLFDVLGEPGVKQSNVLIHMSCAAGEGKFAGLNLGLKENE